MIEGLILGSGKTVVPAINLVSLENNTAKFKYKDQAQHCSGTDKRIEYISTRSGDYAYIYDEDENTWLIRPVIQWIISTSLDGTQSTTTAIVPGLTSDSIYFLTDASGRAWNGDNQWNTVKVAQKSIINGIKKCEREAAAAQKRYDEEHKAEIKAREEAEAQQLEVDKENAEREAENERLVFIKRTELQVQADKAQAEADKLRLQAEKAKQHAELASEKVINSL